MTDLSIVIPAFNEEDRIGPTLESIRPSLDQHQFTYEILVVNDGSNGWYREFVERAKCRNSTIAHHPTGKEYGKRSGGKKGMLEAKGRIRVFLDADGSTPTMKFRALSSPF